MALTDKKYVAIHDKTGEGKTKLKDEFDGGHMARLAATPDEEPMFASLIYQIGLLQEELDYLRTEISANKDKSSITSGQTSAITANTIKTGFPGLGTSSSTALAGNTTTISSGQASAITANTAKVSMAGGSATTLSFGEMITVPPKTKGGASTYNIIMTATKSGVSKTVTLALA